MAWLMPPVFMSLNIDDVGLWLPGCIEASSLEKTGLAARNGGQRVVGDKFSPDTSLALDRLLYKLQRTPAASSARMICTGCFGVQPWLASRRKATSGPTRAVDRQCAFHVLAPGAPTTFTFSASNPSATARRQSCTMVALSLMLMVTSVLMRGVPPAQQLV